MNKKQDIREIIAAKINGSTITNNLRYIIEASKNGRLNQLYDRQIISMMAACDFGKNWENLSKSKTLFYMLDGKPQFNKPSDNHETTTKT